MAFTKFMEHHGTNENFKFGVTVLAFEIIMVILYAFGTTYSSVDLDPLNNADASTTVTTYYGFVHHLSLLSHSLSLSLFLLQNPHPFGHPPASH